MRVSSRMITDQVVFNIQRSMERFLALQTEMSSGRRINKPSDDPVGTLRDLDYRTELSKLAQFQDNLDQGQIWLATYDTSLADINDLLAEAKDVALSMSNDTFDEIQRESAANEVRAIFDRLVQLSESQLGGRQMFSGHRTKLDPLQVGAKGVTYLGDDGRIEFEVESQKRQAVNLTGADVFLKSFMTLGEESDLNVGVTGLTQLSALNSGDGPDLTGATITIDDQNLVGSSVTVDLGAAPPLTTVDELLTRINNDLTAAGMAGTVSVGISDDGNSLRLAITDSGQISTATNLSQLNSGGGVDLPKGDIHITDGSAIDFTLDLSSAVTVGDVISQFNARMTAEGLAGVTLAINAAGTGFEVTDSNVPPLGLVIENSDVDDLTAEQLGLTGTVGAQLIGSDLNPQSLITISDTTGTVAQLLGLEGDFNHTGNSLDLEPQLSVDSLLTDLRNGLGFDGDSFVMYQGSNSYTVDLTDSTLVTVQDLIDRINLSGLDVTASINAGGTGIQIANDDRYRSFSIEEVGSGLAAKQMGLFGSSDMMGSLLVLEDALASNDLEGINRMLEQVEGAMRLAQETRSAIGTKAMAMETTANRLLDMELSFTKLLASVEDADMTKVITELATRETSYQAALSSAAKIIQPSLLDFLR